MSLLCLDTSTEMLCIGLQAEKNIFTYQEKISRKQSEYILPVIQDLLSQAHITLQDLNAIAFGQGPGSFMGVRLACSVAQGLAFGSNLPLISVSSLQIIAQHAADQNHLDKLIAGIDARMGEIYWGVFERDAAGCMQCVGEEKVSSESAIADASTPRFGTGWSGQTEPNFIFPNAAAMLKIAREKYRKNEIISATQAEPVYLRNAVAPR